MLGRGLEAHTSVTHEEEFFTEEIETSWDLLVPPLGRDSVCHLGTRDRLRNGCSPIEINGCHAKVAKEAPENNNKVILLSPLSLHTGLSSYPWRTEKGSGAPTLVCNFGNPESTRHTKEDQPDSFHIPVHCAPPPPGQVYRSTQIPSAWIGQAMTFFSNFFRRIKACIARITPHWRNLQ